MFYLSRAATPAGVEWGGIPSICPSISIIQLICIHKVSQKTLKTQRGPLRVLIKAFPGLPEGYPSSPKGSPGLSKGSPGLSEGSPDLSEGSTARRGFSTPQKAIQASQSALKTSQRALKASQKALQASQKALKAHGKWTNGQNFSPFYRTLSPTGAAAQKPPFLCNFSIPTKSRFCFYFFFAYR